MSRSRDSCVVAAGGWVRSNRYVFLMVSALMLVPCFWQKRIEAGDLSSHLYNAWLAELIAQGQLPSLWLARQWTNVLFDVGLAWLLRAFGAAAAEKIAASIVVLIFFWSAWALVCAASHKAPGFLLPCIAMLTYGWVFHEGLFNYHLALGLSLLFLALFWRGTAADCALAFLLLAPAWLAHPLPVLWALAAAGYIWVAQQVQERSQISLLVVSIAALIALRLFLAWRFQGQWYWSNAFYLTGADQVCVFGPRYLLIGSGLAVFWGLLAVSVRERAGHLRSLWTVPAQLYLLTAIGLFLLPSRIVARGVPFAFIQARMSLMAAVLACGVVGSVVPGVWHRVASGALAAVFFAFLYGDARAINRLEDRVAELVRGLPRGARVVARLSYPGSRATVEHLVDRACIGRCFSYGNVEPSSGQFRVRAAPGNRFVVARWQDPIAIRNGEYVVRAEELPLYQIEACRSGSAELCLRALQPGEPNGR